ncbi:MAG: hypothetical protein WCD19_10420, partial [Nitrososphaeraceae archaeon]
SEIVYWLYKLHDLTIILHTVCSILSMLEEAVLTKVENNNEIKATINNICLLAILVETYKSINNIVK